MYAITPCSETALRKRSKFSRRPLILLGWRVIPRVLPGEAVSVASEEDEGDDIHIDLTHTTKRRHEGQAA